MSANILEPTGETSRHVSNLAIASLLCGLAVPVIGYLALAVVGSDFSDLLTLTIPLFLIISLVLSALAHRAIWRAPERLSGTGVAKAGAILATLPIVVVGLLIPAT